MCRRVCTAAQLLHDLLETGQSARGYYHRTEKNNPNRFVFNSSLCLISAKHLDETEDSATRVLCSMRWSLIPHYHKGSLTEYKPILNNCRVETIEEKPTFKVPLRNGRRCVILAEG